jgi:hypothetical protein
LLYKTTVLLHLVLHRWSKRVSLWHLGSHAGLVLIERIFRLHRIRCRIAEWLLGLKVAPKLLVLWSVDWYLTLKAVASTNHRIVLITLVRYTGRLFIQTTFSWTFLLFFYPFLLNFMNFGCHRVGLIQSAQIVLMLSVKLIRRCLHLISSAKQVGESDHLDCVILEILMHSNVVNQFSTFGIEIFTNSKFRLIVDSN